jgi:phosphinothricin acetyltransferase
MVTAELTPTTVEARQTWFRAHDASTHPIWVATLRGRVAAWLSLSPFITRAAYRHTAEISVYVAEDFRKRGIGSQLLERAIKNGPGLGLEVLVGNIFAHNIPSLHLFEQHGFERWGVFPRVARLDGIARDLVVVGRHLA